MRFTKPFILLAVLAALAGCSDDKSGNVRGTVTFDNAPLPEGTVTFVPVDGKSQTASAAIKDGKFAATVPLGEMKVQFSAPKATGKKTKMYDTPDSPTVDETKELIPDKFGVQSTLKITVKPGGQDETFTLTSK